MMWDCATCSQEDGSVMYKGGQCSLCLAYVRTSKLEGKYKALQLKYKALVFEVEAIGGRILSRHPVEEILRAIKEALKEANSMTDKEKT